MRIVRTTYAYMERGGAPPVCELRTVDADVQAYLHDHVTKLAKKVDSGRNSSSKFMPDDPARRQRFEDLLQGDDDAFLAAAAAIAGAIQDGIRGNALPGLCVAMTVDDGDGTPRRCAILKLEVHDKNAGILREIAAGTRELVAVHNLLVRPKDLQKGGLYPDPRADSHVVVGDQLDVASLYFLRGLGVIQHQTPQESVVALRKAYIAKHPARIDELYDRFDSTDAATVRGFLESNADLFDEEDERDELLADLENRGRPVHDFSPQAARSLTRTLAAGPIRITGPAGQVRQATWHQRADGLWEITLVTAERPEFLD